MLCSVFCLKLLSTEYTKTEMFDSHQNVWFTYRASYCWFRLTYLFSWKLILFLWHIFKQWEFRVTGCFNWRSYVSSNRLLSIIRLKYRIFLNTDCFFPSDKIGGRKWQKFNVYSFELVSLPLLLHLHLIAWNFPSWHKY